MPSSRRTFLDGRNKVVRDYRSRRRDYWEQARMGPHAHWGLYWEWVNGFTGTAGAAPSNDLRLSTPTQPVDRRGPAVDDRE